MQIMKKPMNLLSPGRSSPLSQVHDAKMRLNSMSTVDNDKELSPQRKTQNNKTLKES